MAVGLNEVELVLAFVDSFRKTQGQFNIAKVTADIGVNPQAKEALNRLRELAPELITDEQFTKLLSIFSAFVGMILANNQALAKVIPHVEA